MLKEVKVGGAGLRGKTFSVPCEGIAIYTGPNGSGKTTRLSALQAGLRDFSGKPPGAPRVGTAEINVQGAGLQVVRDVGSEHNIIVIANGKKTTAIRKGQAMIDGVLDGDATDVWELGGLIGISEDKQRGLVLKVAGVQRPYDKAEASARIKKMTTEVDDAIMVAIREDVAALFVAEHERLTQWTTAARPILREAVNAHRRVADEAKKARDKIPQLKPDNLPSGRISDVRKRHEDDGSELRRLEDQATAFAANTARRDDIKRNLDRAHSELDEAESLLSAIGEVAGDRPDFDRARSEVEKCDLTVRESDRAWDTADREKRMAIEHIAELKDGRCPFCGSGQECPGCGKATALGERKSEMADALDDKEFELDCASDAQQEARDALDVAKKAWEEAKRWKRHDEQVAIVDKVKARVVEAEEAAKTLPPEVDPGDLQERIDESKAKVKQASDDLTALERHAEAQRMDLQNRQDHEQELECVAALQSLEVEVRKIETEVIEEACGVIEGLVNAWVKPVLAAPWKASFKFWQEPWEFGLEIDDPAGAGRVRAPFSACSDAQQATIIIGLQYAMRTGKPWVGILVDGLERFDLSRIGLLAHAAASLLAVGALHAFLGGLHSNDPSVVRGAIEDGGGDPDWIVPLKR